MVDRRLARVGHAGRNQNMEKRCHPPRFADEHQQSSGEVAPPEANGIKRAEGTLLQTQRHGNAVPIDARPVIPRRGTLAGGPSD